MDVLPVLLKTFASNATPKTTIDLSIAHVYASHITIQLIELIALNVYLLDALNAVVFQSVHNAQKPLFSTKTIVYVKAMVQNTETEMFVSAAKILVKLVLRSRNV